MINVIRVKELMADKGLSVWQLFKLSGLSYPTVKRILEPDLDPDTDPQVHTNYLARLHRDTVRSIAQALQVEPTELDPDFVDIEAAVPVRLRSEQTESRAEITPNNDNLVSTIKQSPRTALKPLPAIVGAVDNLSEEEQFQVLNLIQKFILLGADDRSLVNDLVDVIVRKRKVDE